MNWANIWIWDSIYCVCVCVCCFGHIIANIYRHMYVCVCVSVPYNMVCAVCPCAICDDGDNNIWCMPGHCIAPIIWTNVADFSTRVYRAGSKAGILPISSSNYSIPSDLCIVPDTLWLCLCAIYIRVCMCFDKTYEPNKEKRIESEYNKTENKKNTKKKTLLNNTSLFIECCRSSSSGSSSWIITQADDAENDRNNRIKFEKKSKCTYIYIRKWISNINNYLFVCPLNRCVCVYSRLHLVQLSPDDKIYLYTKIKIYHHSTKW